MSITSPPDLEEVEPADDEPTQISHVIEEGTDPQGGGTTVDDQNAEEADGSYSDDDRTQPGIPLNQG